MKKTIIALAAILSVLTALSLASCGAKDADASDTTTGDDSVEVTTVSEEDSAADTANDAETSGNAVSSTLSAGYTAWSGEFMLEGTEADPVKLKLSPSDDGTEVAFSFLSNGLGDIGAIFETKDISGNTIIINLGEKGSLEINLREGGASYRVLVEDKSLESFEGIYKAIAD